MARNKISRIPPRKAFWVACEGKGEMAFVAWLNLLARENGKPVHLEPANMGGGSQESMLEKARRKLVEAKKKGSFVRALLLVDRDRQDNPLPETFRQDTKSARLTLILQEPNFEGVLCRLHSNYNQQELDSQKAKTLIKKLWPDYDKAKLDASQLRHRFGCKLDGLDALQRLAERDEELRNFLTMTNLLTA
jgi:hypothetical protein